MQETSKLLGLSWVKVAFAFRLSQSLSPSLAGLAIFHIYQNQKWFYLSSAYKFASIQLLQFLEEIPWKKSTFSCSSVKDWTIWVHPENQKPKREKGCSCEWKVVIFVLFLTSLVRDWIKNLRVGPHLSPFHLMTPNLKIHAKD